MDRECGVVGLDDCVRDLGTRDHGVGVHDPVGELFPDLGDKESAHARTSSTSQGMSQLESLERKRNLREALVCIIKKLVIF